jgi:hypothetical protein
LHRGANNRIMPYTWTMNLVDISFFYQTIRKSSNKGR